MAHKSPLADLHDNAEALADLYGPPERGVKVVVTYGQFELEYASIRKACGLLDLPTRGLIEVDGADRETFLNRMLTQELKGFAPGQSRRSFWLNRKGRVDADLRLMNLGERYVVDVDVHAAARAVETLSAYVITEDVRISDVSDQWHRLAMHGPLSLDVLSRHARREDASAIGEVREGTCVAVLVACEDGRSRQAIVERCDQCGVIGLEVSVRVGDASAVYLALLRSAHENVPGHAGPNPRPMLRPIGWAAFNVARIEAGSAMYNIDFGPDSLPAETGVLDSRVSFKKGCYLGQEVVARMYSLGHPKQQLVGLKITDPAYRPGTTSAGDATADAEATFARCPETGSLVFAEPSPGAELGEPVGAVTSATLAPMLSREPIALAMVKWACVKPGTRLLVLAEGVLLPAEVRTGLSSLSRGSADGTTAPGGTQG
jgi:folate-binding protein YgfZ